MSAGGEIIAAAADAALGFWGSVRGYDLSFYCMDEQWDPFWLITN